MILFRYNYTHSIRNYCHKVYNIPFCAFSTSFCSETKIKSFSRLSAGYSFWISGLLKNVNFISKSCPIQIESYTIFPKVFRTFTTNFLSKLKPQFQVIFPQNPFPLSTSSFQASLLQTSTNYSLLIDG